MDLPFNPLEYADTFRFPDGDEVDIVVEKMANSGKWMICRERQVLTVDNMWIPLADLDPARAEDVALVGHDRDQALATAYDYANRWRTS
ncbi:hypothetical protein ABZ917_17650 [Nonomuraea wenchangensis]